MGSSTMKLFLLTLFTLTLTVTEGEIRGFKISGSGRIYNKIYKICPDCFGEYQLLPEKSHNGRPVYQSLPRVGRNVRYFISIGSGEYITRNISDSAVRDMKYPGFPKTENGQISCGQSCSPYWQIRWKNKWRDVDLDAVKMTIL